MDDIIKKLDLYELLQVEIDADIDTIKKAYRKQALKCHPDKNPDPKAADQFRQLQKALEILSDDKTRDAYNKILRACKEQALRAKAMDSKRKKFKDDLEARERLAREQSQRSDEERLQREIERLRREGSRILEEENELLKSEIQRDIRDLQQARQVREAATLPRLKCRWKPKRLQLTEVDLRQMFEACGRISIMVVSSKGNSAIVEFEQVDAAVAAYGLRTDQFEIEWVQGKPADLEARLVASAKIGIAGSGGLDFANYHLCLNLPGYSITSKKFDQTYERRVLNKLLDKSLNDCR